MATDNSNIEKLLDEMKKKQSNELAAQLTEALGKAFVYVPATMPKRYRSCNTKEDDGKSRC